LLVLLIFSLILFLDLRDFRLLCFVFDLSAIHCSARSILMRNQQSPFCLVGFVPPVFGFLLFLVANFHSPLCL
jgi:hypothetical protein